MTAAWFAVVALFFLSAFFSCSETAVMGVNPLRLQGLAGDEDQKAKRVARLRDDTSRLLSGILLGNNFVNILLASLATALAQPVWGEMAPLWVSVILTPTVLVFAEIVPKTIAAENSLAVARFVAAPLGAFLRVARPLITLCSKFANGVIRLLPVEEEAEQKSVSVEDLLAIASVGRSEGSIEEVTADLLGGLYDFINSSVQDVMVPRTQMISLHVDDGLEGLRENLRKFGHTRMPVWRENEEDIIGMVHAKDLLHRPGRPHAARNLEDLLRPVVYVPETANLGNVLRRMQAAGSEMVLVVDEYGGIEGLVTLKDALEELVGDLEDEHDDTKRLEVIRPGCAVADAGVTLRYLARRTELDLSALGARTLGGLLVAHAPEGLGTGQSVVIDGTTFTVLEKDGRFVRRVRVDWGVETLPQD